MPTTDAANTFRLLITFADDTGGAVRQLELHDMVYGWGVMVIYYAIHPETETKHADPVLSRSVAFSSRWASSASSIPAVVGAVALFYYPAAVEGKDLRRSSDRSSAIAMAALMLGYLSVIRSGLFYELADKFGINLMFRDVLFAYYQDFYEISPAFLGQGSRFIYEYGVEHAMDSLSVTAVHNVFLEFYIEMGFWCWCAWLIFELSFRVRRVIDRYSVCTGGCADGDELLCVLHLPDGQHLLLLSHQCYVPHGGHGMVL